LFQHFFSSIGLVKESIRSLKAKSGFSIFSGPADINKCPMAEIAGTMTLVYAINRNGFKEISCLARHFSYPPKDLKSSATFYSGEKVRR
jgi:hypothetical protein